MKHRSPHVNVMWADRAGRETTAGALADANEHGQRETRTSIARECGPVVYAARLADGVIKIGFTKNIGDRLRYLGCNFEGLLALVPGTLDDERAIHARLVAHRARGREYYHPVPEVLDAVNIMRATFGIEPLT